MSWRTAAKCPASGWCLAAVKRAALTTALLWTGLAGQAAGQACPGTILVSDLFRPLGIAQSNLGNLLVSESGTFTPHSGRVSIVDPAGLRRTLLDGLPSGINDVAEPAGPAGLVMRGRTLYLLIGIGDSVLPSAVPGRQLPNPDVSSPLFSSVLAIHFSANVEKTTAGFRLSQADQEVLGAGDRITLSNGHGEEIAIEVVANFPDHVPNPLPDFPDLVRGSNPFGLVLVADRLYVTDGGRNLVWQVDVPTGEFTALAEFPVIANPLLPLGIGGPVVEAVPTGIEYTDGRLLVTLFRGVPFPPGTSVVVQIDPSTGQQVPFISGLKTAIEIIRIGRDSSLVLQHSSGMGPFFPGPGVVLRFATPGSSPELLADCLARPTSMALDERAGVLYVAELLTGRIVALQIGS